MRSKISKDILALLDRGSRIYHSAALPDDIERGPIGECFDWCIVQAMNNPRYRYVEGVARVEDGPWILHAWLTDQAGIDAYDPTWAVADGETGTLFDVAMPVRYIGAVMDTKAVAAFMRRTEYQGVLANHWRAPGLADRCLPERVAAL